jgi:hypothetical protein
MMKKRGRPKAAKVLEKETKYLITAMSKSLAESVDGNIVDHGVSPFVEEVRYPIYDIARNMNFNLGNAIKYIHMADSNIDVLNKAKWYLEDEIERLKELEKDRV